MKAVNLIPQDARNGERKVRKARAGNGGIGAFVVLGVLAMAVIMVSVAALANKGVAQRKGELAAAEQHAQAAESKAAALQPYTDFAALSKARVETVGGLLEGRFDWAHGLREVARVVPADVKLVSLIGTTSPSAKVEGAAGGGSLRGALPVPAIDLTGCARSQARVATLIARLRTIDGVKRVSLASSEKSDSISVSTTDCRMKDTMPQFQVTVFYAPQDGIVPAVAATAPPTAPSTAAPAAGAGDPAGGIK